MTTADEDWFKEKAEEIVHLVRAQNWKNGGVLVIDEADAVDLVTRALCAASSSGAARAAREVGDSMLATFDRVTANPVSQAVAGGHTPTMEDVAAVIAPNAGEGEV